MTEKMDFSTYHETTFGARGELDTFEARLKLAHIFDLALESILDLLWHVSLLGVDFVDHCSVLGLIHCGFPAPFC